MNDAGKRRAAGPLASVWAASNRRLLQWWLADLRAARNEPIHAFGASGGPVEVIGADGNATREEGPWPVVGYRLNPRSPDSWALLLSGLERALNGDNDPFRLRHRGRAPTFHPRELVGMATVALVLRAQGRSAEAARFEAAAAYGCSDETVRDALRNPQILEAARLNALHFVGCTSDGRAPPDIRDWFPGRQ